jgi:DNA-binding LytR/AlgR family response regulator
LTLDKLRCIAIDDEPLALEVISNHVSKLVSLDLLKTFTSPLEALTFLRENLVDIVFLDIEMPQISGLKLSELIPSNCSIVMVTAYEQHAVKSYDLDVADYLLKPISFDRFLKSINKIIDLNKKIILKKDFQIGANSFASIFVRSDKKIIQLPINQIEYIEGLKDYLIIQLKDSKVITRDSLKNVLAMLAPYDFIRTHKSYIVAISQIKALEGNLLSIKDRQIPVGGTFKEDLLKIMDQRLLGKR